MPRGTINVGGLGQTHGNVQENTAFKQNKPNYANLAQNLGIVVGGIKKDKEEESKKRAIATLNKINVEHANSTPEIRNKAIEDAKGGLGADAGFFDKLLIDEDEVVKAYDSSAGKVKGINRKRGAEQLKATLRSEGKTYEEIQKSLTKYYLDGAEEAKGISESQMQSYLSEVSGHALALDDELWAEEHKKIQADKMDNYTELLNRSTHDALQSTAGIDPSEITNIESNEELEALQGKYRDSDGNIDSDTIASIVDQANNAVSTGKNLGLSKDDLRRSVVDEYTQIANTYQDPDLYEALWSKSNNGVVPKERYPEEYIKGKQAIQANALKYKTNLQAQHTQKVKENNDAVYNQAIEPLLKSRSEYQRDPSNAGNRNALQKDIFEQKEMFNQLRSSGAFVGNHNQEKAWIESIGYSESLLISNEPVQGIMDEYERLRDNKELTKTWMAVNGSRLSTQYRVEGGDIVDRYDKMATEEARSSYRRQERIVVDDVNAVKVDYEFTIKQATSGLGGNDNDRGKKLLNDFEAYSPVIAKTAEKEFIDAGGDPLDHAGISLAVRKALDNEYASRVKEFEKLHEQQVNTAIEQRNKDKGVETESTDEPKKIIGAPLREEIRNEGWDARFKAKGLTKGQDIADDVVKTLIDMDFKTRAELVQYMDTEGKQLSEDPQKREELINVVMAEVDTHDVSRTGSGSLF